MEGVGQTVLGDIPAFGQAGLDAAVGIDDEALIDIVLRVDRGGALMRVHVADVGGGRNREDVIRRCRRLGVAALRRLAGLTAAAGEQRERHDERQQQAKKLFCVHILSFLRRARNEMTVLYAPAKYAHKLPGGILFCGSEAIDFRKFSAN